MNLVREERSETKQSSCTKRFYINTAWQVREGKSILNRRYQDNVLGIIKHVSNSPLTPCTNPKCIPTRNQEIEKQFSMHGVRVFRCINKFGIISKDTGKRQNQWLKMRKYIWQKIHTKIGNAYTQDWKTNRKLAYSLCHAHDKGYKKNHAQIIRDRNICIDK